MPLSVAVMVLLAAFAARATATVAVPPLKVALVGQIVPVPSDSVAVLA